MKPHKMTRKEMKKQPEYKKMMTIEEANDTGKPDPHPKLDTSREIPDPDQEHFDD